MIARCDLCNEPQEAGTTVWEYVTPTEVATEAEAKESGKFWVEDPRWCICPVCHRLIVEVMPLELLTRAIDRQTHKVLPESPENLAMENMMNHAARKHITNVHALFWKHLDPAQTKTEVL